VKLEGTLALFPLGELIEMVVYSSVTGVLNIYGCTGAPGSLYFRDGVLYHVERAASEGIPALAELFELTQANFAFVSDVTSERESLWGALNQHLQTAERLAGRWRQLRAYIPNLELIPLLLVASEAALRRIGPAHQAVFKAIDGQSNLRQIALGLGWAEIDVAEAIVQMSVDGLIDLRSPQPPPAAEPAEPVAPTPRAGGGFFDRMRARTPPRAQPGAVPQTEPITEPLPSEPLQSEPLDPHAQDELILKLLRG
jgi:hypothetical protein